MPRNESEARIFPLANGLRDRLGARLVGPGEAAAMSRIEHNRMAVEAGNGSLKVTRNGPKLTALDLGAETFRNGHGSYVLLPANDRYYSWINTPSSFSLEYFLEIYELPSTSGRQTLLCHGAPYTSGRWSWELNLVLSSNGNAQLTLAWHDATTGTQQTKSWSREFYLNTEYQIRVVFNFTPDPDEFSLYVNGLFHSTIDNQITTTRTLSAINAPIYVGGIGMYDSSAGGQQEQAKVKIHGLRFWNKVVDVADPDVIRFSSEVLDPVGHSDEEELAGWWPMDEGYGRVVKDQSRWGNDGYMGPSALVVTEGQKAADGAIFLDGHTSFLQADFRFQDLFKDEFHGLNQAGTARQRWGLSIRCAVLDKSYAGSGNACVFAELQSGLRLWTPAVTFGYSNTGLLEASSHWNGALSALAGPAVIPGQMKMLELFANTDGFDGGADLRRFYVDGALEANSSGTIAGGAPDNVVRLRVGATADGATDQQTPWSRFTGTTGRKTVSLLVEEIRVWVEALSGTEVVARWEKPLTDEQILENLGAQTGTFTEGSATVVADGTPDTALARAQLFVEDEVEELNTDTAKTEKQAKHHYISGIAGLNITLGNPYAGKTASGKRLIATRLGGYWHAEGPNRRQVLLGTAELRRWDDIDSKPTPDLIGDVVETGAGGAQVGLLTILQDRSRAGNPLKFGVDPYEDNTPPARVLPRWVAGIMPRNADNPGVLLTRFQRPGALSEAILLHQSSAYKVDPRWRNDSPYGNDPSGGSLHFDGGKDGVEVVHSTEQNQNSTIDYWSFQGWVKFDKSDGKRVLWCKAAWSSGPAASAYNINVIAFVDSGRLHFRYENAGNGRDYSTDGAPIKKDTWHYLEATRAGGSFFLFIGGVAEPLAFVNVGAGGTTMVNPTDKGIIGNVPEFLRNDYKGFSGQMTDVQIIAHTGPTAGLNTAAYLPPSSRVTVNVETEFLFDFKEGVDARCFNEVAGGVEAEVISDPFVPIMQGLGVPLDNAPPTALTFNEKFYACTGQGSPRVYNGIDERRMGIVPPSWGSDLTEQQVNLWDSDNPDYAGTNSEDENEVNFSARFSALSHVKVIFEASRGYSLEGNEGGNDAGSDDIGDSGAWDVWFKPDRLDRKMVLMGKNFGDKSGNYWIELIPNAGGTALKARFAWWDLDKKAVKYFDTGATYDINSTTSWWYLLVATTFGAIAATRDDYLVIGGEAGATGNVTVEYGRGHAALTTSGDLDEDDKPDSTDADVLWGWSKIVLSDKNYFPFSGRIAEIRYVADVNRNVTHPNTWTQPLVTPDHIFKEDPTDAVYETGGAAWAGTNMGQLAQASYVFNMNEGSGLSLVGTTPGHAQGDPSDATIVYEESLALLTGTHRVRVTFYDPETGVESNPGPESFLELQVAENSNLASDNWMKVDGLPISGDTRKEVHRRIYKTAANGVNFHLALTVRDNATTGVVVRIQDISLTQEEQLSFNNSYPPFFRVAAADDSRIFIGKEEVNAELASLFDEIPNQEGSAGVVYSNAFEPEYFPATNLIPLDSPEGSKVQAMGRVFGQMVFFMRDGIFVSNQIGTAFATSVVETDGGCVAGLSVVSAKRNLYRPGEQGIYAFSGVSDEYRGHPIGAPDGTWGKIDSTKYGLISGVYWRERDQAIWLVQRTADVRPRTRIALDLQTNVNRDNPASVFTVSDGPDLSALGIEEDVSDIRQLWAADNLGFVHRLDVGDVDGPRGGSYGPIVGAVAAGGTASVINTAETNLDQTHEGHRNEVLTVVHPDGREASERIRSNTGSQFTLFAALPFTPPADSSWSIGLIRRYWRTGFIPYGAQDEMRKWGWLHLSFEPRDQGLLKITAWIDFDTSRSWVLDRVTMEKGWAQVEMFRTMPRGKFLQLEFSAMHPFMVYDYTVGETRSGPGRY